MDGPGMKLISAINQVKGDCDIIAEDLGIVTDDVRDLIKKSGYPGMKVLQFAFVITSYSIHYTKLYD